MSKKKSAASPDSRHVRGSIINSQAKPAARLTVVARSGNPDAMPAASSRSGVPANHPPWRLRGQVSRPLLGKYLKRV